MTQERQTEQSKLLSERREGETSWSKYSSRSAVWKRSKRAVGLEGQWLLGVTSACFSEVGLWERILHFVTIFHDGEFWEAVQVCDKPNHKNSDG